MLKEEENKLICLKCGSKIQRIGHDDTVDNVCWDKYQCQKCEEYYLVAIEKEKVKYIEKV